MEKRNEIMKRLTEVEEELIREILERCKELDIGDDETVSLANLDYEEIRCKVSTFGLKPRLRILSLQGNYDKDLHISLRGHYEKEGQVIIAGWRMGEINVNTLFELIKIYNAARKIKEAKRYLRTIGLAS
jgi:hypothetical protein